jgi:hypothetical protein
MVDPGSHDFRMSPLFGNSAPQYDWINRIAVAAGRRFPDGPLHRIFEVL